MNKLIAIVTTACSLLGMIAILGSIFLIGQCTNRSNQMYYEMANKCSANGGTFIPMNNSGNNASCIGNSKGKE